MALLASALVPASVPSWASLQSATPSAVASVTFSGLSGFTKYRLLAISVLSSATNVCMGVQLNADAGSNYLSGGARSAFGTSSPQFVGSSTARTCFESAFGTNPVRAYSGTIDIENALLAVPKTLEANVFAVDAGSSVGDSGNPVRGVHNNSVAITSITILSQLSGAASGTLTSGTIKLLGAN